MTNTNRRDLIARRAQKRLRRAQTGTDKATPYLRSEAALSNHGVHVFKFDPKHRPGKGGQRRMGEIGLVNSLKNPTAAVGEAIRHSLDPQRAPGKVRTMDEISAEELAEIERRNDERRKR